MHTRLLARCTAAAARTPSSATLHSSCTPPPAPLHLSPTRPPLPDSLSPRTPHRPCRRQPGPPQLYASGGASPCDTTWARLGRPAAGAAGATAFDSVPAFVYTHTWPGGGELQVYAGDRCAARRRQRCAAATACAAAYPARSRARARARLVPPSHPRMRNAGGGPAAPPTRPMSGCRCCPTAMRRQEASKCSGATAGAWETSGLRRPAAGGAGSSGGGGDAPGGRQRLLPGTAGERALQRA